MLCYEIAQGSVTDRNKKPALNRWTSCPLSSLYFNTVSTRTSSQYSIRRTAMYSLHHLRLASLVPLWIFSGHDGQWNTSTVPSTLVSYCVCVCFFYIYFQHTAPCNFTRQYSATGWFTNLQSALYKLWKYSASMWCVLIPSVIIGKIWGNAVAQLVGALR